MGHLTTPLYKLLDIGRGQRDDLRAARRAVYRDGTIAHGQRASLGREVKPLELRASVTVMVFTSASEDAHFIWQQLGDRRKMA